MLKTADIKNFTAFGHADLAFASGLNVFIGENGTGKSHLLKLFYSVLAASAEEGRKPGANGPTKTFLQPRLAEKLIGVFRPESLGRLARRKKGRDRCEVALYTDNEGLDIAFSFAPQSKSEVTVDRLPNAYPAHMPVFFPTRELLTLYPGFLSLYESHHLEFEETWRDACLLLGGTIKRITRLPGIMKDALKNINDAMDGGVTLDKNGRFYIDAKGQPPMEMPLVAEGFRKLAMLARLIANGSLHENGCLFWDEPEANLNPKLIRLAAEAIFHICKSGIQVFVATHSLFLIRELSILSHQNQFKKVPQRYFALESTSDGVSVSQGDTIEHVDPLVLLDENLSQSDRFLAETDE